MLNASGRQFSKLPLAVVIPIIICIWRLIDVLLLWEHKVIANDANECVCVVQGFSSRGLKFHTVSCLP